MNMRMGRVMKWGIAALVAALMVGGIARSIMARKAEQASITQTAQSMQQSLLRIVPADFAPAQRAPLSVTIEISGSLRAVDSVVIKSRVSGELKSLTVREGDAVRKGQLLGLVDADEYKSRLEQARQQAASAQAQLEIAQRTLDNNQALVAQGFISKNALDTSISNAAGARANLQAARAAAAVAQKSLSDTQLRSPIQGLVSQQFAQAGERVAPDSRIVEVVDLSRMELEAALKPEDLTLVKVGTPALLSVDGLSTPVKAKVARINPSADPGTRAVTVYLSVSPLPQLRQGLFAKGQLSVANIDSIVVPASAIRRRSGSAFVQLVKQDGQQTKVAHQSVTLGPSGTVAQQTGTPMVAVLGGLQAGDKVLRESVGLLREGTVIEPAATPGKL